MQLHTLNIPGDVTGEAKRECERQLVQKRMTVKSGALFKANPADALHMLRVIRRKHNPMYLDFALRCLTQTADTFERRTKIKVQEGTLMAKTLKNQWCLLCKEHGQETEESTTHIFTCPTMLAQR